MTMLAVEHIVAGYYEEIDILNDLSLGVESGTITGIIGPNGAGKSTLLRTIFGFLPPSQGRILFLGQEIQALFSYRIKRLGISYVPQAINTFPQLTVEENLLLGAWTMRKQRHRVEAGLERMYTMFPAMATMKGRKAAFLSGGQAKMLSIAKELITEPRLVLVDEPTAGLAPKVAAEMYEFLERGRHGGLTILLVDQNIAKAVEISDYLYMLEMGSVKLAGPREVFATNLREIIRDSLIGV
jgi:ABC-type branched-subunit amino acid transport system ATPase component